MPDPLVDAAQKCDDLIAQIQPLRGSRDYSDRAMRIALRRELRDAQAHLRDAANDLLIDMELAFAGKSKTKNQDK